MQIAEETGLIVPIGDWVLQESLKAVRRWNADTDSPGVPLTVAVNLSFKQFDRTGFFEFVRDSLRDSGVKPDLLEL